MARDERDDTQDWLIPEGGRLPLLTELVVQIDEALRTAKASEAAVMTVGAAAMDAAQQAQRAAGLAERATGAVLGATRALELVPRKKDAVAAGPVRVADDGMRNFTARADRITARLRELERTSFSAVA